MSIYNINRPIILQLKRVTWWTRHDPQAPDISDVSEISPDASENDDVDEEELKRSTLIIYIWNSLRTTYFYEKNYPFECLRMRDILVFIPG